MTEKPEKANKGQKQVKKPVPNYLEKLPAKVQHYLNETAMEQIGEQNIRLIATYLQKCSALPSQPSDSRLWTVAQRMKKVSLLLDNKALTALTEKDLQNMNLTLRTEGLESATDYRKILKHYLKTTDRKKYLELIDSDFLKNPPRRNGSKKLVDPNDFWTEPECNRYLEESSLHSPKQSAWASLWLSSGCRPHELLGMHKKDLVFEEPETLVIRVGENTKTGKRSIVLQGKDATGVWHYLKSHWESLKDNEPVFGCSYQAITKIHGKICKRAHIGKDRKINFYIARKSTLTRFYNEYGLVKAASMSGHTAGSSSMRHYVGMTEGMLKKQDTTRVQMKTCPNPSCGSAENEPHESQCKKCGSPLNKEKYAAIFSKNMAEFLDERLALFRAEMQLQIADMKRA